MGKGINFVSSCSFSRTLHHASSFFPPYIQARFVSKLSTLVSTFVDLFPQGPRLHPEDPAADDASLQEALGGRTVGLAPPLFFLPFFLC